MSYNDILQVTTDAHMYMALYNQETLTLDLFPYIIRGRLQWFSDNWQVSLYQQFKDFANGDADLEKSLADFNKIIQTYQLGATQNFLNSSTYIIEFLPFFAQLPLTSLLLTPNEQNYVNQETTRVQNLTISDFREMVTFLVNLQATQAALLGGGDPQGLALLGLPNIASQRQGSFNDFENINNLIKFQQLIEGVIVSLKSTEDKPPNLIDLDNQNIVGDAALDNTYLSSVAVPFQYSLEAMAQTYLGDKSKWMELVTINKLQPPFIDEYGTKFSLIVPGGPSSVTIPDTLLDYASVGQKVAVGSLTYKEEIRVIQRNVDNLDGTMTLYLSGDNDLNNLLPSQMAYVRIYSPGTVNSGSMILIPLDVASTNPTNGYTPSSDQLRNLDGALLAFGVDIQRDEKTGDFLLDVNGDFQFAAGVDNVRQAIFWAIRTRLGELPFHPLTYGVNLQIGDKYFGTADEVQIFSDLLINTLLADSRFSSIKLTNYSVTGNSVGITLQVTIQGSSAPIPLSYIS